MSQYYFLTASLPYILPESGILMDSAAFLSTCETNMSPEDYRILLECRLDPSQAGSDHPFLRRWTDWEISLRNELVKLRAQNLKIDGDMYIREGGETAGLFEAAKEAAGHGNPLDAELRLDKLRWAFLDELEAGHIFDLEKLLIYYLKLQILERHSFLTAEKGTEAYGKVYETVISQIQGS